MWKEVYSTMKALTRVLGTLKRCTEISPQEKLLEKSDGIPEVKLERRNQERGEP